MEHARHVRDVVLGVQRPPQNFPGRGHLAVDVRVPAHEQGQKRGGALVAGAHDSHDGRPGGGRVRLGHRARGGGARFDLGEKRTMGAHNDFVRRVQGSRDTVRPTQTTARHVRHTRRASASRLRAAPRRSRRREARARPPPLASVGLLAAASSRAPLISTSTRLCPTHRGRPGGPAGGGRDLRRRRLAPGVRRRRRGTRGSDLRGGHRDRGAVKWRLLRLGGPRLSLP